MHFLNKNEMLFNLRVSVSEQLACSVLLITRLCVHVLCLCLLLTGGWRAQSFLWQQQQQWGRGGEQRWQLWGGYGDITTMGVELFPKDTDMLIYDGVLMRTWPYHRFLILKQLAKSLKLLWTMHFPKKKSEMLFNSCVSEQLACSVFVDYEAMRTCTVFSSRENEGGSRGTFFDDDDDKQWWQGRRLTMTTLGGTMPIAAVPPGPIPPVPLVPMLVDLTLAMR